jgi:hypothetical protein
MLRRNLFLGLITGYIITPSNESIVRLSIESNIEANKQRLEDWNQEKQRIQIYNQSRLETANQKIEQQNRDRNKVEILNLTSPKSCP